MRDLGRTLILLRILSDGEIELFFVEQVEDVLKICVLGMRKVLIGLLLVFVHLIRNKYSINKERVEEIDSGRLMFVVFWDIQLNQLEQYFNHRILPLEYNQTMKTPLLLLAMLALSLAQSVSLSNCFIANLDTSLCIKCNDGYQLS